MTAHLPHGYDAWRTTPPDDLRPRGRFMPAMVEDAIRIDTPDVTIEVTGTYDADTGSLLSVHVNGADAAPRIIEAIPGVGELPDLDPARLEELINQSMQDAEADYGDYLRDLRDDR